MLFGLLCISIVQSAAIIALIGVVVKLRDVVLTLQEQVYDMSEAQDKTLESLDKIEAGVAQLVDLYTTAAAKNFDAALADAKAAWEADDEAKWTAAQAKAQAVVDKLTANLPITPPATPSDPNPAPIASPADPSASAPVPAEPAPTPETPAPAPDAPPAS